MKVDHGFHLYQLSWAKVVLVRFQWVAPHPCKIQCKGCFYHVHSIIFVLVLKSISTCVIQKIKCPVNANPIIGRRRARECEKELVMNSVPQSLIGNLTLGGCGSTPTHSAGWGLFFTALFLLLPNVYQKNQMIAGKSSLIIT